MEDAHDSLESLEFINEPISNLPLILMDKCYAVKLIYAPYDVDLSKNFNVNANNSVDVLPFALDCTGKCMKMIKKSFQRTNLIK